MKSFNIAVALIIVLFILSSCTSETGTFRKMTYIAQGDSLQVVEYDSLLVKKDSIQLLAGKDTLDIEGNILQLHSSIIAENDTVRRTNLFFGLKNNKNKTVVEINISDSDTIEGFDEIKVKGDISELPEELHQAMIAIDSYANTTLENLKKIAKKKVTDLTTGEEKED